MNIRAAVSRVLVAGALLAPSPLYAPAATGASVTPSGASLVIVGDFNGDTRSDVLVYAPGTTADHLFYGTPTGFVGGPTVTINGTYVPFTGDFNGDGHDDVFWYDPYHAGYHSPVWFGQSSGFVQYTPPYNAPHPTASDVYTPVVADFDHDGSADIAWANTGPGTGGATKGSPIWYGNPAGHNFRASVSPLPTVPCLPRSDFAVVAQDFNGDGFDDLVFYRAGNQPDKLVLSTGSGFTNGSHIVVNGTYLPLVGDFDGDGLGDLFWYAAGKPGDVMWTGKVHGSASTAASISGSYTALVGDFDGDAHSDIVWYTPGPAHDYLRYGKATLFRDGPAIDVNGRYDPAVGDFNGDGKADIVWVAPLGHDSPVWYGAASGFTHGAPVAL